MAAFDEAWNLMKAPLDMDSIKRIPNEWGDDRATADFVDPKTGIRYPMTYTAGAAHDEAWGIGEGVVQIRNPPKEDGSSDNRLPLARATVSPAELEYDDPAEWLQEYGGHNLSEEEYLELLSDYTGVERHCNTDDKALIELATMLGGQNPDLDLDQFMYNRRNTTDDLNVDGAFKRRGMGTAMYDLLHALGRPPTPNMNQNLRGRLMWMKNQGIEDHRFAPPYQYPDELPAGKRRKRLGDIEYDMARIGGEQPPVWRGQNERL